MKKARVTADNKIVVKFTGKQSEKIRKQIKALPEEDVRFVGATGEWELVYKEEYVQLLRDNNFDIPKELYILWKADDIDDGWKDVKIPKGYEYLFGHQKDAVRFSIYHKNRVLLALDMGMGKSLTALSLMDIKESFPVVIISPSIVKRGFEREYFSFIDKGDIVKVIESSAEMIDYHDDVDILIINYELIARNMVRLKKKDKNDVYYPNEVLRTFAHNLPEFVICDEIHKIQNLDSQTTKGIQYLLSDVPNIIALTGTPVLSSSKNLFPILNLLRPDLFPNYYRFVNRYCQSKPDGRGGKTYYGARNSAELNSILTNNVMFRLTKDQGDNVREKPIISVIPIPMSDPKVYLDLEDEVGDSGDFTAIHKLKDEAWNQKKKGATDFITEVLKETDDKITIFAHNKAVIDHLMAEYGKIAVKIDGSISTKGTKRLDIIDKFVGDSKIRIIVCGLEAVATGTNGIQKGSSTAIFIQFPWIWATMDQGISRLDREGQKKQVNVYHLPCEDSIEESILGVIDRKHGMASEIVDGEILDEKETLKELLKITKKKVERRRRGEIHKKKD